MAQLIYVADDDVNLLAVERAFLEGAGFELRCFQTGDELRDAFMQQPCDLVILDVMMPGTDGLAVCRQLREISDVPIIILTAKESEEDYITGLALGGDDYLFKPFSPSMLVMRVRALLRRVEMTAVSAERAAGVLSFGDLRLSERAHEVRAGDQPVPLTLTEFSLLRALLGAAPEAASRAMLLREVWGIDAEVETRVTDETVRRVRAKLRRARSKVAIKAIWGFGYRLEQDEAS